jgi:hypothetical protein
MSVDAPPPVLITAVAPAEPAETLPLYGPVDTEAARDPDGCGEGSAEEIVVCGEAGPDDDRPGQPTLAKTTSMEDVASAVEKIKVGPVELTTGGPKGSVGLGLRLQF